MRARILGLRLLVVICGAIFFAVPSRSFSAAAVGDVVQHWEHRAMTVDADESVGGPETSRKIVQLGNEGWELVSVESFVKDGTTTKLAYYFKRPK